MALPDPPVLSFAQTHSPALAFLTWPVVHPESVTLVSDSSVEIPEPLSFAQIHQPVPFTLIVCPTAHPESVTFVSYSKVLISPPVKPNVIVFAVWFTIIVIFPPAMNVVKLV